MTEIPVVRNVVSEKLKGGKLALGMIVRLCRTGDIAKVAKATDHDFIFIDSQHGVFTPETISDICQVAHGCGVAPLVRVGGYSDQNIGRILDAGAMGIVVPDVNSAAEAKEAVSRAKFAPLGRRSVGGGYPIYNYLGRPPSDITRDLNASTLVICMIETAQGLNNVEEIAAVPGVDVVHVGCNDLLHDMGKAGAFGSPEIMQAIRRVIGAAKKHGKFAGLGGERNEARQAELIRDGVQFVTTHSDFAFLMAEATRRTSSLRSAAQ